ncbi:MAG TPA: hypothetical protein VF062_13240 [Candidatus Limnocylindrales bacterium]
MNLTELLVTGYDGDKAVFATNLTAESAASILAATSLEDGSRVEAGVELAGPAFRTLAQALLALLAPAVSGG